MRYLKGSRVEVMNRRDSLLVSWRCAEIVAGNGHAYSVMYDCCSPNMGVMVDRVPRKAIRPCPPSVKATGFWAPGDVVEVFEEASWKPASVLAAVGGDCYLVRILGSCEDFRAHEWMLRVRQIWQNDRWVVIQKKLGKCDDEIINNRTRTGKCVLKMPPPCVDTKEAGGNRRFPDAVDAGYEENWPISSRSMKKRRPCPDPLPVNECDVASRKMRAVEVQGGHHRLIVGHPSHLPNKVDAVTSPCTVLGEKYMHASLNNKSTRFYGMGIVRRELNAESESICSSVGSCSVNEIPSSPLYYPVAERIQDSDGPIDEAESSRYTGRVSFLSAEEDLEEEIHCHELNAYHSTMLAFYASGPLTWEKEALLSNLRLLLHISIDEHLLELRHLISAKNSHLKLQEPIPNSL